MLSVQQAKDCLFRQATPRPSERISTAAALGRVLASDVLSPMDVPVFDNSAMDGYAFGYSDAEQYTISQEIPAGSLAAAPLARGEAARIFTGAPLPAGADTVVPQELVERTGVQLRFDPRALALGANVRLRGAQCRAGAVIATAGTVLKPGALGLLASVGVVEVEVYRLPSVAVIVTGNELQAAGSPLQSGQIYDSNSPLLRAFLQELGISTISSFQVKDDPQALADSIQQALQQCDVLILSGGISVGDYDYVQDTLLQAGVDPLFYKIKQKPGKPLFVGKRGEQWVFALPGNPAAVVTCWYQYLLPTLRTTLGHRHAFAPLFHAPLATEWTKKAGLTHFLKAYCEAGQVHLLEGQDSFNLLPFAQANCLVQLEEDQTHFPKGTLVPVFLMD